MDDYERVKDAIDLEDYCNHRLKRRGPRNYVCPFCGSGDGPSGTAAFYVNGKGWKCFSCNAGGDVFDLIGHLDNLEDKRAQLAAAAGWAHIFIEETAGRRGVVSPSKALSSSDATTTPQDGGKTPENARAVDYSEGRARHRAYLEAMRGNLQGEDETGDWWLDRRGYSLEDAVALGIGYDPQRRRIILPWKGSDYYHIDRSVDHDGNGKYDKPKRDEVGPQPVYNLEAVKSGRPFVVVEGVMDALAVELSGYEAVALGGTGTHDLEAAIEGVRGASCVLMLDNDAAGRDAEDKLAAALKKMGVPFVSYYDGDAARFKCKDADEEHLQDAAALEVNLGNAMRRLEERAAQLAAEAWDAELETLEIKDPAAVAGDIWMNEAPADYLRTGLAELDRIMGGGLPSIGLVILGAMSSTGKTTLCVQIADGLARRGTPVLFATLEQSAAEIVSKSVARMASSRTRPNGSAIYVHPSDLTTRTGREGIARDADKNAAVVWALNDYAENVAPNLRILECEARPNTARFETAVRAMARHYGQPPVLIVDYLQIVAPPDVHMSDKQAADANIGDLRRLARDARTCVLAVSSLNRASYNAGGISLESFKESGGIEYGADVLLGLQPRGLKAETADKADDAVRRITREKMDEYKRTMGTDAGACAEIVLLKNRNGAVGVKPAALIFHGDTGAFEDELADL